MVESQSPMDGTKAERTNIREVLRGDQPERSAKRPGRCPRGSQDGQRGRDLVAYLGYGKSTKESATTRRAVATRHTPGRPVPE